MCNLYNSMTRPSYRDLVEKPAFRFPQSLENALGVLVQGTVFALILAAFRLASEPSTISIDSAQSLQDKKRAPVAVKTMPRRELLAGWDGLSAWRNPEILRLIVSPFHIDAVASFPHSWPA